MKAKIKDQLPCGRPAPVDPSRVSPSSLRAKLSDFIRANDLKNSDARDRILDLIIENTGHFGIQDLIKQVQKRHPDIGSATVYRNMTFLCDAEIIRETLTKDTGEKLFELAFNDHHDHIICINCNQVFEFNESVIESAQDRLGKKLNFKPVKHRHIIYANCLYGKN